VNDKEAFILVCSIQVLIWVNFKNIITHLETDWLNLWSNCVTALWNVTESCITGAIKVWKGFVPLSSDFLEDIWWNR